MGWKRKLVITTLLFGSLGYGGYYAYDSGYLEEVMSTTPIPFQYLRVQNRHSAAADKVKVTDRLTVPQYREMVAPVTSLFVGETKPALVGDKWSDLLDPIYGVEYTYVGSARLTGLIQDADGWNPLVTLSVFNDSEFVRNITLKLDVTKDLEPTVIRDENVGYDYAELPDDFNMALVDLASSTDDKFMEKKSWETTGVALYPEEDVNRLKESDNQVRTRTLFIYSDSNVQVTRRYGTATGLFQIDRHYTLDLLSSNKNMFLVPMTIKAVPAN